MTPNEIEVLLHCHSCPTPHPRLDAPAVREALEILENSGAIAPYTPGSDCYGTTDLGNAWVKALCNTPPPRMVYIDAQGNVLT